MTKTIRQKNYFASIGNRHGNHGQNIGDLGDPTLVDMLVMGMSGLISTFHCVTSGDSPQSPLLAQSKSLEKGRARSPQRRQSPSLCSSVKSTRQFLHLFELATNKQTDFNSSLLSRLPICHYTFMVQGWITGMSKSSVFLEYKYCE